MENRNFHRGQLTHTHSSWNFPGFDWPEELLKYASYGFASKPTIGADNTTLCDEWVLFIHEQGFIEVSALGTLEFVHIRPYSSREYRRHIILSPIYFIGIRIFEIRENHAEQNNSTSSMKNYVVKKKKR